MFNNAKYRAVLYQVLALLLLLAAVGVVFTNVQTNLEKQGIASGFAFLSHTSGFGITMHLIDYHEGMTYGRVFWIGLLNTLVVAVTGIIGATILGFIIGFMRLSKNFLVNKIALTYIEIFRNIPLLLQIFFWYFVALRSLPSPAQSYAWFESIFLNNRGLYFPSFHWNDYSCYWLAVIFILPLVWLGIKYCGKGKSLMDCFGRKLPRNDVSRKFRIIGSILKLSLMIVWLAAIVLFCYSLRLELPVLKGFNFRNGMTIIPELAALWLALTIYTAAFIAEIVRSGINSIPKGQMEAASALALPPTTIIRRIILPQALRVIIPPLTNQHLNLAKNSSLAAAIAYPDLVSVFAGTVLNQTGQAVEVITMTMGVYLVMSLTISVLMNWLNAYYSRWGNVT